MRRKLTLTEVINNLTNSYRFIDIRSIVGKQDLNYDWSCIFSKIRLTDDDSEKIKDIHSSRKQNLGIEDNEQSRFRFLAECRDIQGLNDIVDEIHRGQVTIRGVTSRLQNGANEASEVQKYDYYSTPEEKDGYHQWFIFLPNSGGRSTYKIATDLGITQEDIGLKLEFLNTWFDIPSTEWNGNTNNLFCQSLGLAHDEVKFIHVGSDFSLQNRPIYSLNIAYLNINNLQLPDVKTKISRAIDNLMTLHRNHKGIIHTTSYEQLNFIKENIS